MKKVMVVFLVFVLLMLVVNCKENAILQQPPPEPTPTPKPTEQLIGRMYFHDTGSSSQFDIFSGDLYLVPKETSAMISQKRVSFENESFSKQHILQNGIHKFDEVLIEERRLRKVVINTVSSVDITKYEFEIRDVENITNSTSDDFAVNINNNNQIVFVTAPDGLGNGVTEIAYMDLTDRVRHQLTPIKGQYSDNNFDPDWKTDSIIIWSHDGKIQEVDLLTLKVSGSLIPEYDSRLYDPKYSPDGTMLIFNTKISRKKNSFIKYLSSGNIEPVLPADIFKDYRDDNPTWVFSNSYITGHTLRTNTADGRIYTYDLSSKEFNFVTDGARDFRYVTPIDISGDYYLIFSDWTDRDKIALWISNIDGSVLRELNQTGDEAIFTILGLSIPNNPDEYSEVVKQYIRNF